MGKNSCERSEKEPGSKQILPAESKKPPWILEPASFAFSAFPPWQIICNLFNQILTKNIFLLRAVLRVVASAASTSLTFEIQFPYALRQ